MKRIWWVLALPPFIFFVVIVFFAIYFGAIVGDNSQEIAQRTQESIPYILLVVQVILLLLLVGALKADGLRFRDIGWQFSKTKSVSREVVIGAIVGIALGFAYVFILSPLLDWLQKNIGDYGPPGGLVSSLRSAAVPFFVANILLAPFVEESLYRGYALRRLRQKNGDGVAALITCTCFGFLHWAGGFWYITLTAIVAGGVFAYLAMRRHIVAAFVAHLVLNSIEYLSIFSRV